jgi:hypothetical protein
MGIFDTAVARGQRVQDSITAGKFDQGQAIVDIAIGFQNLAAGIRSSFDELYERTQRLHQKIDRIEKKIGSV